MASGKISLFAAAILTSFQWISPATYANISYTDGWIHTINYSVSSTVSLDWASPGKQTRLYVVDGAEIIDTYTSYAIAAYEDAIVIISGGYMSMNVTAWNRSTISMFGGTVVNLQASGSSNVRVSGGVINGLGAYDHGTLHLSGGTVSNSLAAFGNGTIYMTGGHIGSSIRASTAGKIVISGTGFNYPYGVITGTNGKLTGTLDNGDTINNYFYLSDAGSIVLIPEPTMMCMFSIGTLVLTLGRTGQHFWKKF